MCGHGAKFCKFCKFCTKVESGVIWQTQLAITCSKLTIETLEQGVIYAQS